MAENTKKTETADLSIDEAAQMQMLVEAHAIENGDISEVLKIGAKKWRLRPTSMAQNARMQNLDFDILNWQRELNRTNITISQTKKINSKIRKAYAKKAAYKILGYRLGLIPFAFALTWRYIYNCSERVSATINSTESISENRSFYLANLGSSKQTLVLSTIQVGESVKQMMQRTESAESMVEQDALPKKAGNK